jgi:hypothetical protein
MKSINLLGLATALAMSLVSQNTFSHSAADADEGGLYALMKQSAAIAYGKVVDIQYRNSEPTREEPRGVPHTFVTYAIGKVLRGSLPERVTLRIPGGADGRGGAFSVTTAPTFARGEADILFIPGGEPSDCQLVNCVEGRFRVLDDRIYSGFGVPLVSAEKSLEFGGKPRFDVNTMEVPRPTFEGVITQPKIARWLEANKVDATGLATLKKKYEAEAPPFHRIDMNVQEAITTDDFTGELAASVMNSYREPLITDEFFALIAHFNEELGEPEDKVVSANHKLRFVVTPPVAAPAIDVAVTPPRMSLEERNFRAQPEDSVSASKSTSPTHSATAQ